MELKTYHCPGCGADLHYNANQLNVVCKYCRNSYTIEDLNKNEYKGKNINRGFKLECGNCGASVNIYGDVVSTRCSYCNSNLINRKRLDSLDYPEYIIPIRSTEEQVINVFLSRHKKYMYSPDDFYLRKNIINLYKIYVPYWLVSSSVSAVYSGSYTSGSGDNSTTYFFRGKCLARIEHLPIDGRNNLHNELMQGIEPLDLSRLTKFNEMYLLGTYSDMYDKTIDQAFEYEGKKRLDNILRSSFVKSGHHGVSKTEQIKFNNIKIDKLFVPVWLMKVGYGNKIYDYVINDSTLKLSGLKPISKYKISAIVVVSLLLFLFCFFFFQFALPFFMIESVALPIYLSFVYSKVEKGVSFTHYVQPNSFVVLDYDKNSSRSRVKKMDL